MNVTSIVLSWNRRDDTLACVAALKSLQVNAACHEVLVVDNGSTDDTVAAVRSRHPDVDVLELESNLGYAAGMNGGVRRALADGADWTMLVNNDTRARPDLLCHLLAASHDPAVGMATPTIYYLDEPDRVWPSAGRRRRWTLAAFDTTASPPVLEPYDVDWATGCCLLVRRELWEEIGLFDERYGFYYEDHDLCLRARSAGWRIVHVPRASILHRVAASTGEGGPRQAYLLARGSVAYYARHSHGAHRVFIVAYRLGSLGRTLLSAARAGRADVGSAYVRGLRDGLRDLKHLPDAPMRAHDHESSAS